MPALSPAKSRAEREPAAGGTSLYEPAQQDWNAFAAQVEDPDGHVWMILVQAPDWVD